MKLAITSLSLAVFYLLFFSSQTITYYRYDPQPKITAITAEVTKYNSVPEQTDDDPFTTASGSTVDETTLACPSRFPFGTKVEIDGQEYTCLDRMNARYREGNYFDIWSPSVEESLNFGRQKLLVYVYEEL